MTCFKIKELAVFQCTYAAKAFGDEKEIIAVLKPLTFQSAYGKTYSHVTGFGDSVYVFKRDDLPIKEHDRSACLSQFLSNALEEVLLAGVTSTREKYCLFHMLLLCVVSL